MIEGDYTQSRGLSGILVLTGPDGKVYNIRVNNVTASFTQEKDMVEDRTFDGSIVVGHLVHSVTHLDMEAIVETMTIIDKSKTVSPE